MQDPNCYSWLTFEKRFHTDLLPKCGVAIFNRKSELYILWSHASWSGRDCTTRTRSSWFPAENTTRKSGQFKTCPSKTNRTKGFRSQLTDFTKICIPTVQIKLDFCVWCMCVCAPQCRQQSWWCSYTLCSSSAGCRFLLHFPPDEVCE